MDIKKIGIFKDFDMDKYRKENFELKKSNPENMSYWLPKIESSSTKDDSILQIPETKIIPLSIERINWLTSDSYEEGNVNEFNSYLKQEAKYFLPGETLFMKTGVFSNKFEFGSTQVNDRNVIGRQFLNMFYQSMLLGADLTREVVLRKMIASKDNRPTIYEGMPLHTEFRVFYDYDKKETIGAANYWHPEEILSGPYVSDEDKATYSSIQDELVKDFYKYKEFVVKEVSSFMKGVEGLTGKWSVDVMKNEDDYWLIDMARMERSALQNRIE